MMMLKTGNIKRDLKKIRNLSYLVEKQLSKLDQKDAQMIEKFSFEELQDLNQLLHAADYLLSKYEDKKEIYSILKEFIEMLRNSSDSMDFLNDEINELVVSAENAISRIKNLQSDVSENFSLDSSSKNEPKYDNLITPKNSTNNLTNSSASVYTHEYLRKSEFEID